LGQNGLLQRFAGAMFSAHTLGVAKPDPGLFLAAAGHFGVAPQDCVVVEDSATGALAARRAGMRCFGYAPDGDGDKLAAESAHVFDNMLHLPRLLSLP
jgi:beta-phosphoglucomutase-like phosphatase (HAD superfamily)